MALAALDLVVAPGEIIGILGPNGAGKSTLLRLLSTGHRPSAGTLELLGTAISHQPSAISRIRRRLGIIPDDSVHADALTGRENAQLFARASGAPGASQRADALLARLELAGDAERPVAEYSLGMRRRLVLVQALAHEPALVLGDEPTTGIDPVGREVLRQLLRERVAAGGAVVLASNDIAEVEMLSDRVLFLNGGAKVLEGAPKDLVARLGGSTRFELRVRASAPPRLTVPGLTFDETTTDRIVARSANGSMPLPALCAAVLEAGAAIDAVEVHPPDLSEVFLRATGQPLAISHQPSAISQQPTAR